MIELDPTNRQEMAFAIHKAVRFSGLTLAEVAAKLESEYGVKKLSLSALSHVIHRGTIGLQRALQILDACGVTEIRIKKGEIR